MNQGADSAVGFAGHAGTGQLATATVRELRKRGPGERWPGAVQPN